MKQHILTTLLIIILGCNADPKRQEIVVNKTVKVFSENYHDIAENYTFKWQAPIGPNDEKVIFDLKKDMLIFTPKIIGNYEVSLSIEDISEEIVEQHTFLYIAIPETSEVVITELKDTETKNISKKHITINEEIKKDLPLSNKKPKKKSKKKPKKKKERLSKKNSNKKNTSNFKSNTEHILQISAWPTLEEARKHQLELISIGFDAYTERYFLKEKDELWYRVRVGNFSNKNEAIAIKKQIESLTGINVWLNIVSKK